VVFCYEYRSRENKLNIKLSAGSTVETQCTRCRQLLNHTIVAMVGEKIVRVECNTCHGMHNYRAVKPVKEPAAPRTAIKKPAAPRKAKADPEAAAIAEWSSLQSGMDADQAIPYDMNRSYRVNNLLNHSTFGLGIVQSVMPNKIDVLFQVGKKRLRCG
jgi:hypothetical protein